MKSVHVTSNNEQLYTVIHSPKNIDTARKNAVVICSPITNEHDTCYWAMRQLAHRLSRHGFHVVRFDYYATGNSSGLSQQLSIETCVQNIVDVGQYILDNTDSQKLTYIGLRMGATLASLSAIRQPPEHLILWDPLMKGEVFLNELAMMHEIFLEKMRRNKSHQHKLGQEYLGYPYSDDLISEISKLQQIDIELPLSTSLSILNSPDNIEQVRYIEKVKNNRALFQHEETTQWPIKSQDVSTLDSPFLPGQSINQICNILKARQ